MCKVQMTLLSKLGNLVTHNKRPKYTHTHTHTHARTDTRTHTHTHTHTHPYILPHAAAVISEAASKQRPGAVYIHLLQNQYAADIPGLLLTPARTQRLRVTPYATCNVALR